jgi:hypothetical protein
MSSFGGDGFFCVCCQSVRSLWSLVPPPVKCVSVSVSLGSVMKVLTSALSVPAKT